MTDKDEWGYPIGQKWEKPMGEPRLEPVDDEHYEDCPCYEDSGEECICAQLEADAEDYLADHWFDVRKEKEAGK